MGWGSPPKPDPKLVKEQDAEAQRAKLDRIDLIQSQLGLEDQLRAQVYGMRDTNVGGNNSGGDGFNGGGFGGGGGGYFPGHFLGFPQ